MTSDFTLDHPVIAVLIFAVCSAAGGALGVAITIILNTTHLLSDNNVLAGAALGIGGSCAGMLAAVPILIFLDRRTAR